jgi:hypothetical protein
MSLFKTRYKSGRVRGFRRGMSLNGGRWLPWWSKHERDATVRARAAQGLPGGDGGSPVPVRRGRRGRYSRLQACAQVFSDPAALHELGILVRPRLGIEVSRENGRLRHDVPVLDEQRHLFSLTFPHGVHEGLAIRGTGRGDKRRRQDIHAAKQGSQVDARRVVKMLTGPLGWWIRA